MVYEEAPGDLRVTKMHIKRIDPLKLYVLQMKRRDNAKLIIAALQTMICEIRELSHDEMTRLLKTSSTTSITEKIDKHEILFAPLFAIARSIEGDKPMWQKCFKIKLRVIHTASEALHTIVRHEAFGGRGCTTSVFYENARQTLLALLSSLHHVRYNVKRTNALAKEEKKSMDSIMSTALGMFGGLREVIEWESVHMR
jgi:hypothetical protein